MEWLMFGAGWVTGWLVLGVFATLVVLLALVEGRRADSSMAQEADAHERVTWPAERPVGRPLPRCSLHPLDVAAAPDGSARNGARPWRS